MTTSDCTTITEELVAYLDGEQSEAERARIDVHLRTCLACRREADRLGKVTALLRALPSVEPSATFGERLWDRLERVTPSRTRRSNLHAAFWGLPALAAAAVVTLVLQTVLSRSFQEGPGRQQLRGTRQVATDTRPANVVRASGDSVDEPHASRPPGGGDLLPDDLPPALVEHPELFLRLPVVRRLDKLQHFEEVRRSGEQAPAEGGASAPAAG